MALLGSLVVSAEPPPAPLPSGPATQEQEEESALPGDWAPELLDAILSSPNPEARDVLLRAAFAAGQSIIPQLEAALKDDRTAEFAAESLAFIGGPKALDILAKLENDARDLALRRFFYGALGEFSTPQATQVLLDAVNRADKEPDRTVTEAAILALTVRSDLSSLPPLREAQAKMKDVVIRDDLENALEVIERRRRYLESPEGKKGGGSIERAVHTYFMPAFEPPSLPAVPKPLTARPAPAKPTVKVEVKNLIFSPDKTRALARVTFEDPSALANYDMVLQKQYGDWAMASVWLGSEVEKTSPASNPASAGPE